MKTIDLNQQEQEMLVKVLERYLGDLDHEISHTDHGDFKQILRQRQVTVAGILHKLPGLLEHAGAA